jgi:3D (Asp-Asp-Asp) domain-containing protein
MNLGLSSLNHDEISYPQISKCMEIRMPIEEIEEIEEPITPSDILIYVKTTAYNEFDSNTPGNIMASGKRVYEGSVAYNQLPLETKIEIDGITYVVEDRCAYDNVIDIYMNTIDKCNEYGVQYKKVKVKEN